MNNPEKTHNLNDKLCNQHHMEWHNAWTREYGVQYGELIITAMGKEGPSSASILDKHILYPENKNEAAYMPAEEKEKLFSTMENLVNDPAALENEIKEFERTGQEYMDAGKRISEKNVGELENSELLKLYENFRIKWMEYTSYLWSMFIANEIMSHKTERLLESKSKEFDSNERFEGFLRHATSPHKKASILKLNHELRELKLRFCEEKLEEICNKYKWMSCLDVHYDPWNKEKVKEYFETHDHSEEPDLNEHVQNVQLSDEERDLIELNRKMTYYKELRDEYRRIGIYHAQGLFREIGKRMGLCLKEVSFLKRKEIHDFLTKGEVPDRDTITERFDGFLVFEKDREVICVSGEQVQECASMIGFRKNDRMDGEVKGKIASKGKVEGIARILLNEKDLEKISKGDVLVALTTGPSYVPAMAKAAAFVTDQGGITCHAAIVAREMKKPCIVGTQNATRVLKDGDLVEVDANKGTVKKLSQ